MTFSAIVLTLFPEMFPGPLGCSLAGKALEKNIWSLEALNIRDFAKDKHKTVDDSPYGGGVGMVMKPDVVDAAIEGAKARLPGAKIIYTSPRGVPLNQELAGQLKNQDLIILCGRFEGVDQRVIEHHNMLEISLGDFVLSGGEIAAMAMLDACVRLLPGVIGKEEALAQESFSISPSWPEFRRNSKAIQPSTLDHPRVCKANPGDDDFSGLLEYPHYTRPPVWNGRLVPDMLLSGNHQGINAWRLKKAREITAMRRPDLLKEKE